MAELKYPEDLSGRELHFSFRYRIPTFCENRDQLTSVIEPDIPTASAQYFLAHLLIQPLLRRTLKTTAAKERSSPAPVSEFITTGFSKRSVQQRIEITLWEPGYKDLY